MFKGCEKIWNHIQFSLLIYQLINWSGFISHHILTKNLGAPLLAGGPLSLLTFIIMFLFLFFKFVVYELGILVIGLYLWGRTINKMQTHLVFPINSSLNLAFPFCKPWLKVWNEIHVWLNFLTTSWTMIVQECASISCHATHKLFI